ncbi:hypothetical protein B1B_13502 [mine drainage metagenome]|uniref:DUF2779 domain-containing protein n=1 Tax=mine drainage metagenome TaxID=410659 RepID=T1AR33_9ZZZZ
MTTTADRDRPLTKSQYVQGRACRKWLWLARNAPERLPTPGPADLLRMAQGRQVGEWARSWYPGGIALPPASLEENDRTSREMLRRRLPLYEAGFLHPDGTCYARADVLVPVGRDEWDVVEVKSAGGPKDEHLDDVAFQRVCYVAAGLRIRQCRLLHINTRYERSGEIDPRQLFTEVDITAEVDERARTVASSVAELLEAARAPQSPEFERGEPYHDDDAGVHDDDAVWREHPDSDIRSLYRAGRRQLDLLERGVFRIRDIPDDVALTDAQQTQRSAHASGRVHIDRPRIAAFLATLRYPVHFLDFETFATPVPLLDGVRPYQPVPFQFSLHIVEAPGAPPTHRSFLSLEPDDPRPALLRSLRSGIGRAGHLIAYNQAFEKRVLADLAARFPAHADWVEEVSGRFVDLWAPFRRLDYYDPAQRGSASLKAVLPAIAGLGYEGLDIADGGQASSAYLSAAFGIPGTERPAPVEVEAIRSALERYCGQDTLGMVRIVERLTELSRAGS